MFAAMVLTVSTVALTQLAIYYWRAVVGGVAAQPISESVRAAAGLDGRALRAGDFSTFADLNEITPTLQDGISGFGLVNAYYHLMSAVGQLSRPLVPALAAWTETERATCSRYAAVLLDRRMKSNLACSAALRSC
jgi:hypothetical protein